MNAINPDRLPAEVRASIEAQAPGDLAGKSKQRRGIRLKTDAPAPFDLNDAIAENEAIAARSAEIEAELAEDLAIIEAAEQEREVVELACLAEGYSNGQPLPTSIQDRHGERACTKCGASFHPPKAAPNASLCRDCYEQRKRDLDGLAERARGHWPEILVHFGIDREHLRDHHGPCPGCGGSDRFRFDNDKDRGTWVCGGGGDTQAGDGFALLSHVHGWSAGEAFLRVATSYFGIDDLSDLPPPDPALTAKRQAEAEAARAQEQEQMQRTARHASLIWEAAETITAETPNPYLTRKGVHATKNLRQIAVEAVTRITGRHPTAEKDGTRQRLQGVLLVVPYRRDGELSTVELIDGACYKSALPGKGTKKRAFWLARPVAEDDRAIIIAEGVATALSIMEATGYAVAASGSVGNMHLTAAQLKAAHPQTNIILAADLKKRTSPTDPVEPIEAAVKTAQKFRPALPLIYPVLGTLTPVDLTDFNDLHQTAGLEMVRNLIAIQADTDTRRPVEPEREPEPDTAPTDRTPPPWFGKIPPKGWKLTRKLVSEIKEKSGGTTDEYIPTCGPLWVVGRTTGAHGQWGLVLGFLDHNGHEQRLALPASRLHGDPSVLVGDLSEMGLKTFPGREKKTLAYLGAWDVEERILSAKRLGWLEDPTGALAFVMPDHVIGRDGNRELVYQPDRYSPTVKTVHAAGSLEQWRTHVARPAGNHPPMRFALCAGLAPALLAFAEGADSYVLHFWGTTSKGKTTLAQLSASPWGCAADPADAPSLAFIRRWNLTGNGLEGLAEAHSDLPLVLDELGAATVGDIRPLVYQLAGGQGKTAMNSAREMREPRSWRTIAISTGEMSLHARMSDPDQDGKRARSIKGGLTHRALDVEVSDIAANADKADREALVSGIKQSCARFYGTAGPEFVRRLAARFGTMAEARAHVRALVETILGEMATPGLQTETRRALRRFALIAAAGELASELDVLPVAPAKIREAAQTMARSWLSASAETDEQRIIASVRAFILAHASRFERVNEPPRFDGGGNPIKPDPVRDRAGFVDSQSGLWWFTDAGLVAAVPGHDKTAIARTLSTAGYLFKNESRRLQARTPFEVDGKRPWLYAIKSDILDEETAELHKSVGQVGQVGQAQQPRGFEAVPHTESAVGQVGRNSETDAQPGPVPQNPVPLVPHGTDVVGQPESQQPRGFVPPVPPVPPKNTVTEKNPSGDAGANGDDEELF